MKPPDGSPLNSDGLSPRKMQSAQRTFKLFTLLNVISFQFLSGNIITLYALRLGAGYLLIGLLFSMINAANILPFFGRLLVRKMGSVRTMGIFWLIRYILMLPILFAPLFSSGERAGVGILLIVISVIGFNMARGIGVTGYNLIIGGITTDKNRGSFLAGTQLIVHASAILAGAAMGLLLGVSSRMFIYTILLLVGIASGLLASLLAFRLPEPGETGPSLEGRFLPKLLDAFKRSGFTHYIIVLVISFFAISMITPFLVVFMKQIYHQGDGRVIFFSVFGSLGAIVMAVTSGFVIDRMGAKPLLTSIKFSNLRPNATSFLRAIRSSSTIST